MLGFETGDKPIQRVSDSDVDQDQIRIDANGGRASAELFILGACDGCLFTRCYRVPGRTFAGATLLGRFLRFVFRQRNCERQRTRGRHKKSELTEIQGDTPNKQTHSQYITHPFA